MGVVSVSSNGQIILPSKIRETFSLHEGDSLLIVEEKDCIRLKPLIYLSHLWGIDSLKNTKRELEELRDEWDRDFEAKTSF